MNGSMQLILREQHPGDTIVRAGEVEIGGRCLTVMAGPCAVEGEEQVVATARAVKAAVASVLRCGAFKPNMDKAAEVADIFQVGSRNMQKFTLLDAVGRSERPILLKRGMSATIEELLLAAERIAAKGNRNTILCERGIHTFEPSRCGIRAVAAAVGREA